MLDHALMEDGSKPSGSRKLTDPIPTVGGEKVSITVTRKTAGDLLVSQHSAERWFKSDAAATIALQRAIDVFIEAESELQRHSDEAATSDAALVDHRARSDEQNVS